MSTRPPADLPSRNQIDKAGAFLQRVRHADPVELVDVERVETAIQVVSQFREAHAYPMLKVRYGLRSMVRTEGAQEVLTQRLKRVPRIVRKLHRMSTSGAGSSRLSALQDIGGCRAVLRDGPELERVRQRVEANWEPHFVRPPMDYIAAPKDIGYRAVHFVVRRDDRAVEVQLRTVGQQQWANAVEQADALHGLDLKDGVGPAEMVEYFTVAAEVIYLREYGREFPAATLTRFDQARRAVIDAGYYRE